MPLEQLPQAGALAWLPSLTHGLVVVELLVAPGCLWHMASQTLVDGDGAMLLATVTPLYISLLL